MSGIWGLLSQDLLGVAPMEGCGLLHLKNAEGPPPGRQATQLKKNGTSPWLQCLILPIGILRFLPRLPQLRDQWGLTPQRSRHLSKRAPAGVGGGGEGEIISKQLLRREQILAPLHCLRNLHLSCSSALPSSK